MSENYTLVVGTVGSGVFQSSDSGKQWNHSKMPIPYGPWSVWVETRCVTVSPHDPQTVYVGTHIGLNRSRDGGANFEFITSPFDNKQVWSIAVHPKDPETIYVGIAPYDSDNPLWRTRDGGKTWENCSLTIARQHPLNGALHVTAIMFDPNDSNVIFASAEIGGSYRSTDSGETWTKLPLGDHILDQDNHCLTVTPTAVFVTSPLGVYRSLDRGETFNFHRFRDFGGPDPGAIKFDVKGYCRGVTFRPDKPETIYVGCGDTTPGIMGGVMISHDNGESWSKAELPAPPNSHMYAVATHPSKPERIVAASMYGYLYMSEDGGKSWEKHWREFSEIRGLAWLPNAA